MEQELILKKNHLESEKKDMLVTICNFIDSINFKNFQSNQINGRPRLYLGDVIKALSILSYHSWSYRRCNSDLELLKEREFLDYIPKRSTLNKYMNENSFKEILQELIEYSAQSFIDYESIFMSDSSWFYNRTPLFGMKMKKSKIRNMKVASHSKTTKLHVTIARESKIITCARASIGSVHDYNFFLEMIKATMKNGFKIKTLLADSAYNAKEAYSFCEDNNIDAYLDFKSNHVIQRSKSKLRKDKLILYRTNNKIWHEAYRFRVLIEAVFSAIKRKNRYILRSRNHLAQQNEVLLKALCYNLNIISKFVDIK